ncbi:hypothetical protein PLESTB_001895600 [Pleodorina starrii]|uniref:Uncharacterized protein n=1 Tax=Pleodorina starrii TaxID=330485 RepID=A0A9W6C2B1_9CHLO|nr:hypothetical protein PLESTB_001895600 [Pleodorina starrii]GLC77282.1 hypothetical protein PLESTF_001915000 [Pleodorina starrii]
MHLRRHSAPSAASAAGVRNSSRPLCLGKHPKPPQTCILASVNPRVGGDTHSCDESRPASTDAEVASFSGRVLSPLRHQRCRRTGDGLSPRASSATTAWRAVLATAASACILLPGLPAPLPGPQLRDLTPLDAALVLATPRALAAEPPSGSSAAGAAKMEAIRQLASPDLQTMREVSEELSSRPAPPGVATASAPAATAAAAGRGEAAGSSRNLKARLKADDLALLLGISPAEARSIMASERELGRATYGSVRESFDAARELLGLGGDGARQREQAGRLLVRQPRVLLVPAAELRDRFLELQSLLSVPTPLARRLVASQPGLLTHGSATLRSRLSGLCSLFNVDPSLAASLAAHHPGLLAVNAGELAGRSQALKEELSLNRQQVVAILRRHPRALLLPSEEMHSRLRSLSAVLEVPRGEALGSVVLNAPRLVVTEVAEVGNSLQALEALLQIPRDRAAAVASEHPALLVTHGSVLQERLRTLAELGRVPLGQARSLVLERPSLLTKSSAAMRRAVMEADAAEEGEEAAARREGQQQKQGQSQGRGNQFSGTGAAPDGGSSGGGGGGLFSWWRR